MVATLIVEPTGGKYRAHSCSCLPGSRQKGTDFYKKTFKERVTSVKLAL